MVGFFLFNRVSAFTKEEKTMNQFHEGKQSLMQQIDPIQERIIQKFLSDDYHKKLYQLAAHNPTGANLQALDNAFKEFYGEIRMIKYISNSLYFNAVNFDKRYRLYAERNQLMREEDVQYNMQLMKMVSISMDPLESNALNEYDLIELVEDEAVLLAMKELTDTQRTILHAKYALHLADIEIAQVLNISQQAVSKSRNSSLKKIQKFIQSHD